MTSRLVGSRNDNRFNGMMNQSWAVRQFLARSTPHLPLPSSSGEPLRPGPVGPLFPSPLDAERALQLLAIADDDVGVRARDAVPPECRESSRPGGGRGLRAVALGTDGDDGVLVRPRAVVLDHGGRLRSRNRRLLDPATPEL